jgi:endonuclease/exonuclease/phosphatase family metal-dependent hydrolase
MGLRILSYNIHGLPWIQCPIETILLWAFLKSEADVICLQEVFTETLKQKIIRESRKYRMTPYFPPNEPACFGRKYLRFGVPCGLCILVADHIDVTNVGKFSFFLEKGGLDRIVNKGYFSIDILYRGHPLKIVNTHFQSDFSEISCMRLNYDDVRDLQESQLYAFCLQCPFPVICGDFNQNTFRFFQKFDDEHNVTFPSTGEHLDHLLLLKRNESRIKSKKVIYFSDVDLSDHIPVLFELGL